LFGEIRESFQRNGELVFLRRDGFHLLQYQMQNLLGIGDDARGAGWLCRV
jgi:hypothetical protein